LNNQYNANIMILDMLVLGCLRQFSTICQLYRGCQFYWWRKPEYPKKTTDLPQVIDKLYHTMFWTCNISVYFIYM